MQLRHTSHAQFSSSPVLFSSVPLLETVVQATSTKGLISTTYSALLENSAHKFSLPSRAKWEHDIGPIPNKGLEEIIWALSLVPLSPSHRLTQIFILHRDYRTPECLCTIGLRADSICPRCGNSVSLIHLLWLCHKLQRYWAEFVGTLNRLLDVNLSVDPLTCLLHAFGAMWTSL